jgi:Peptidase family M49.
MKRRFVLIILLFIISFSASAQQPQKPAVVPDIAERLKWLPRTEIDYDRSLLSDKEKSVVNKLIDAAKLIDQVYWIQVSKENPKLRTELQTLAKGSETYSMALHYFEIMRGRWDRILRNEPFIGPFGEEGKKPAGAGFYPEDMTKDEFEKWVAAHPADADNFHSTVTVIERQGGKLVAVPYSSAYRQLLEPAAQKLKEAASLTDNASLRSFLNTRADAFASNDYYQSDLAWMDANAPIEVVIGPYEVYEDQMFGYKSSFEAFVTVVDKQESEKLAVYAQHLKDMEKNLPEPDEYKNLNRGNQSPIRVVQEIFTSGNAREGVQTAAFNLPNDERVRQAKGSKEVILKNVMQAKFEKTGRPIAEHVLDPEQVKYISFDPYFNHTLFHELSHGLGPGIITKDGKKVEYRILLKDLQSYIEETKADVLGVWNILYAIDNKLLTSFDANTLYVAYIADVCRIMRHGLEEAHGKGAAMQWNWYREKGAVVPDANGKFRVDFSKMKETTKSLATELLTIEATGDYQRAKNLLDKYGKETPEIHKMIDQLKDIPVDIEPIYAAAGEK